MRRHALLVGIVAVLAAVLLSALSWRPLPFHARTTGAPPQVHAAGRADRFVHAQVARPLRLTAANTVVDYPPPPIRARAAYLIDMTSHHVLYAKNANAELAMASTTKITTAALVLAHARLNAMVTVSQQAATIGESTMELTRGERLSVRDLLYGLLLNSGNDAAVALAQYVGGSVAHFVAMMNALAHALGMRHTHYATPHGLDAPHHYTSARDLATMTLYALRDPTFRRIVATEYYHIPATRHNHEHYLGNINHVLYWFPGVDGVKPGQTNAAGLCQVISAWRNDHHLLAVLLNTPNLVTDIRNLLDYGSRDFAWVQAPAWWDVPSATISGGRGNSAWRYYLGAGHYIRGAFLRAFQRMGGLATLGYPRTEVLRYEGRYVQYFQGGELVADTSTGPAHEAALGTAQAAVYARRALWSAARVTPGFAGAYARFGGHSALGSPVTGARPVGGHTMQYFQRGAIAEVDGVPELVPVGDQALRRLGWLPAGGAATAYPATLSPAALH